MPHSEIHGSKVILTSPWLIAEYHVLHRLLLPRHPPNALFALDLIQKKQNRGASFCIALRCLPPASLQGSLSGQKSYFPVPPRREEGQRLVYLTWNKTACGLEAQVPHTRGPAVLMFLSLHDVNLRPFGRHNADLLHSAIRTPRATATGRWWVEMDSNHRPYAYQAYALTT